uniref:SAND domain-containing protein n=1 Tax=Nothobranchius furzeri TaxID=105023 RepID=A0A8C6M716_NOTFU
LPFHTSAKSNNTPRFEVLMDKEWFTPTEFEKLTGKGSNKNWKWSIRCQDTPLLTLIKVWWNFFFFLALWVFVFIFEEENMDTLDEQASATNPDSDKVAFLVTCGALSGQLHKKRFASGRCGKSIRTETRWLTPLEFVYEALGQRDGSWMKDIEYDRKPIGHLIKNKMLYIHSDLCICCLCKPSPKDLKNDDECYVCKSNGELVKCDLCPRSFHQKCHVPQVKEQVIKRHVLNASPKHEDTLLTFPVHFYALHFQSLSDCVVQIGTDRNSNTKAV